MKLPATARLFTVSTLPKSQCICMRMSVPITCAQQLFPLPRELHQVYLFCESKQFALDFLLDVSVHRIRLNPDKVIHDKSSRLRRWSSRISEAFFHQLFQDDGRDLINVFQNVFHSGSVGNHSFQASPRTCQDLAYIPFGNISRMMGNRHSA